MRLAMVMGVLLASVCSAAGAKDGKPVTFTTSARVEVDANGTPVKVDAATDLPDAVRTFVEQQLSQWKFSRTREGEAGNAATWIRLGACAVPKGDGTYALGLAYGGHGPRLAGGATWPHPEGLGAWALRSGFNGHADLQFTVSADGTAKLDEIEGVSNPGQRKNLKSILGPWVADQHFDPEQIAGKPVATRSTLVIEFMSDSGRNPRATDQRIEAKTLASPACQRAGMATVPGLHSVAVDSVVSVEPAI
jgi:hypothetical protein